MNMANQYDDAMEGLFIKKKTVSDLLNSAAKKISRMKTIEECQKYKEVVAASAKKVNSGLQNMSKAAKLYAENKIEKAAFKSNIREQVKNISPEVRAVSIRLGNLVENTSAVTSAEIKDFGAFIAGVKKLIMKRIAELKTKPASESTLVEDFELESAMEALDVVINCDDIDTQIAMESFNDIINDNEDFSAVCESLMININDAPAEEGAMKDAYDLISSDEAKRTAQLIKDGKELFDNKKYDDAKKCFIEANTIATKINKNINAVPENAVSNFLSWTFVGSIYKFARMMHSASTSVERNEKSFKQLLAALHGMGMIPVVGGFTRIEEAYASWTINKQYDPNGAKTGNTAKAACKYVCDYLIAASKEMIHQCNMMKYNEI